jgi:hypothetical protein
MGFFDFFSFFSVRQDNLIFDEEESESDKEESENKIQETITFISCNGLDGGDILEEPSFVKD